MKVFFEKLGYRLLVEYIENTTFPSLTALSHMLKQIESGVHNLPIPENIVLIGNNLIS